MSVSRTKKIEELPPTLAARYSASEAREQSKNNPDVAWYFVKGGMSLHTANLLFRASDTLAVLRIQWDPRTQKTFLARFKRGPGGLWHWVELRRVEDRTRALRTMSRDARAKVEGLIAHVRPTPAAHTRDRNKARTAS